MKKKESRRAAADQHVDRISDLPEEIIHGILYRMDSPSQAARTSILSRRWLHLWRSYPVLEFRDSANRRFDYQQAQKFRSFAAAASRRLHNSSSSNNLAAPLALDAVRLSLPFCCEEVVEILQEYKLQLEISPIEISLRMPDECHHHYHYQSNPSKNPAPRWNFSRTKVVKVINFKSRVDCAAFCTMESLEVLHLDSVKIGDETLCSLLGNVPNLRELTLIRVLGNFNLKTPLLQMEVLHLHDACRINKEALCSLLCNSPKLQTLSFIRLYGVQRLAIDLPSLKFLQIGRISRPMHITSAPLLHTLELESYFLPKLTVESPSSSAPNLRAIVINNFRYRDLELVNVNQLSLYFPSLHSLSFNYCKDDDNVNDPRHGLHGGVALQISSSKLRRLSFSRWLHTLPLHIDAPNCVALHYSARDCRYLPAKMDIVNLASSCQCVFDLSSHFVAIPHSWLHELRKFLAMLAQSNPHLNMVLKVASLESFDQVNVCISTQPTFDVQHLELGTNFSKQFDVITWAGTFLNRFFMTCHPKFLSMTRHNHHNPSFSTYICEPLFKREDVHSCRYCYYIKCWRHQIKEVKLKIDIEDKVIAVPRDDELIASLSKRAKVTFELTWH